MFFLQPWGWNNCSSFCKLDKTNILWAIIEEFFNANLKLPSLTPQSVMLGFSDFNKYIFLASNHISLLFKHFIFIQGTPIYLFPRFFRNIQKVYTIEQNISQESEIKKKLIHKKRQKKIRINYSFINACYIKVGWWLGNTAWNYCIFYFVQL